MSDSSAPMPDLLTTALDQLKDLRQTMMAFDLLYPRPSRDIPEVDATLFCWQLAADDVLADTERTTR